MDKSILNDSHKKSSFKIERGYGTIECPKEVGENR